MNALLAEAGEQETGAPMNALALFKRSGVTLDMFMRHFDFLSGLTVSAVSDVYVSSRYDGYLRRQERLRGESARHENMRLEIDDYGIIGGLRLEAREKLNRIRPATVGQASRISGVTPADINVLLCYLYKNS